LEIATREGAVRVVGTEFSVTRDPLGTHVAVTDGVVEVTCEGGSPTQISAGGSADCLPIDAAGWLARATALRDGVAPPAQVLDAARVGLGYPDDGAVKRELEVLVIGGLIDVGRADDARSAARAYLDAPGAARRGEMARRVGPGAPCHLDLARAAAEDGGAAADFVTLAVCLGGGADAHAALDAAAARATEAERPAIEAWRAALPR
jgi:hypothetical protein